MPQVVKSARYSRPFTRASYASFQSPVGSVGSVECAQALNWSLGAPYFSVRNMSEMTESAGWPHWISLGANANGSSFQKALTPDGKYLITGNNDEREGGYMD